jgi:hypothetical protein
MLKNLLKIFMIALAALGITAAPLALAAAP